MRKRGHITCPRCGSDVKIPLYWIMGIEGVFRCNECRLPFKTGYKMGAVLHAFGLTLAISTVQILVYLLSAYLMAFFVLAIIPLWLLFGYFLRKSYMLWKTKRYARRNPQEPTDMDREETSESDRRLPLDVAFDDEGDEHAELDCVDQHPNGPSDISNDKWDEDERDYRF